MNNVALLISGQCRTLDKTFVSIKNAFPNSDIFIHTTIDEDSHKAELLAPTRCFVEPTKTMPEKKEYTYQVGKWCNSVQGTLKQLWGLKRVYDIYKNSNMKHDLVVRCRPDMLFTKNIDILNDYDFDVLLPKFDNWWGYNDRFAILKNDVAEKYFNQLDRLDEYIENKGVFHQESILKWNLSDLNTKRCDVTFDILRKDGTIVKPEYRLDCGDIF